MPLKEYFLGLPDLGRCFHSEPRHGVRNHVFTDGSFFKRVVFNLDRAAWAVVNASTGMTVSCGCVPGLCQTIVRAELWGLISAAEWALRFGTEVLLRTDSASICRKACGVQKASL